MESKKSNRVLVVEDDELIIAAVGRVLRYWFGRVVIVDCVADGIEALRTEPFDVILADYRLQDGTGAELLDVAAELSPQARRVLWSANLAAVGPHCAHVALQKSGDLAALRRALAA